MAEGTSFSLLNLGGPIEKLIDAVSKAIGTLYKPTAIRKEADARAYELRVIERAKAEIAAEAKLIEVENLDKIEARLLHKEQRRQQNIDNVYSIAANQLSLETEVSATPVRTDWTTSFFDMAQDISEDEMQKLWGKILAEEVKQPGRFSLRTLALLKTMTTAEAKLMQLLANHTFIDDNYYLTLLDTDSSSKIQFSEILSLQDIGLLASVDNISLSAYVMKKGPFSVTYQNKKIELINDKDRHEPVRIKALTSIGKELLSLVDLEFEQHFFDRLLELLGKEFTIVEVVNI